LQHRRTTVGQHLALLELKFLADTGKVQSGFGEQQKSLPAAKFGL
jgi:hypothetical protein